MTIPPARLRVLVIDDERNIRLTLPALVDSLGHEAQAVGSGAEAVAALRARTFDVALLDLKLGTSSGLELLPRLLEAAPGLQVVLMTAFTSIQLVRYSPGGRAGARGSGGGG